MITIFQMWKLRSLKCEDLFNVMQHFQPKWYGPRSQEVLKPNTFHNSEPSAKSWVNLYFWVLSWPCTWLINSGAMLECFTTRHRHFPQISSHLCFCTPACSQSFHLPSGFNEGHQAMKCTKTNATWVSCLHCILSYNLVHLRQIYPELRWALVTHGW